MYMYLPFDFIDKKKELKYFCREPEELCREENWDKSFCKEDLKVT